MLVAKYENKRIEADIAEKGSEYICPNCQLVVTLKKGRIRAHHFAHKPPVTCAWGKGETKEHEQAKRLFRDEFRGRGYQAELEYEVPSLLGDRRADVIIWHPETNSPYALELQHTAIDYNALENRTKSYANAGVRVIWIPFLQPKLWEKAESLGSSDDGDYIIHRFSARPLERWVHGFNFGKFWMYHPAQQTMWKARLDKCRIYQEYTEWYSPEGEPQSAGGYNYISKRWRTLTLWGPYRLDQVHIHLLKRGPASMGQHNYPGGNFGMFVAEGV